MNPQPASRLDAICLTAPTACGKTDLALAIADRFAVEIVSVDSALVYRGMDIGTAKPAEDVRRRVPHHLIDIVEPTEVYSAGRFLADAAAAIGAITERGRIPLLVGGTLLYLRALRRGLANLPEANATIRAAIDTEAASAGWPALHAQLAEVDPQAAARIAPSDRQRIQRALEVYRVSGVPLTVLQREASPTANRPRLHTFALLPPDRTVLASRIERRFDAMVAAGFPDEVRALMARGDLHEDMPSMRAVGYRQMWAYLAGRDDWEHARAKAIAATRQLAKRQMTWLRSEPDLEAYPAFSPGLLERVLMRIDSIRASL